jgi:hypothetical protein
VYSRSAILTKRGVPRATIIMEIRDNRAKEWFWLDNEYLNGYARHLGVMCTNVYISLCRHADNKSQTCFPSMEVIGEEIGVKRNAVSRAIKTLKDWNIIDIKEEYDKKNKRRKNNIYTLLAKSEWKDKPCTPKIHGAMHSKSTDPCTPNDESHAPEESSNYTHINKTHLTTAETSSASNEVVEIIDLFKDINPEYTEWYRNTTQRKAVKYLIEKYGFKKVSNMVTQLPEIISRKYAPRITTPHELKRDLGKLLLFIKQETPKVSSIGKL